MATGTSYSQFIQDNPELFDQVRRQYGVDVAPVPQAEPAAEPATDPLPTAPASAPTPVVQIDQLDARNPYAAAASLQHGQAQSYANDAASLMREGEARQAAAGKQADVTDSFVQSAKSRQADADANHAENRRVIADMQRQHDELLKKLSTPVESKGGSLGMFAAIAASVAGAGGNSGVAQGMQMVQNHVQSNVERRLADRAESARYLTHLENAMGARSKDSADEQDYAHGALANEWFTASRQLEAEAKRLEGHVAGEQAQRLAAEAARNGNAYVEKITQSRIAKIEAQRASVAGRHADDALSRLSDQELMMLGTKAALAKLKERQGVRKGEADIDATLAGTEKTRKEATGAGAGGPQSADERKMVRLLSGVEPSVQNLRAMLQKGDAPPHPLTSWAPDALTPESTLNAQADIGAVSDILLRDESGAAIGKDEQEKKLRGWGINSGDPDVRRRGLEKMLAEFDARMGAVGATSKSLTDQQARTAALASDVRPGAASGQPAPQQPAPNQQPAPDAPVGMIDNTGRLRMVHPSRVPGLRTQGWKTQAELQQAIYTPDPAPVMAEALPVSVDPNAADYDEQVRREQGY